MLRRLSLPMLILWVIIGASCASSAVSFDGERATDAATAPTGPTTAPPDDTASTIAVPPTTQPVSETATEQAEVQPDDSTAEESAVPGLDATAADQTLQALESSGGIVFVDGERACMSEALIGSIPADPLVDTAVLNCLGDDGVHRWTSAWLAAIGMSDRAIIEPNETACVWEQSGGRIYGIDVASAPALQQCGVWGRVNLASIPEFSDGMLSCLDIGLQATRLPDGRDQAALDNRISQCASPEELAIWQNL